MKAVAATILLAPALALAGVMSLVLFDDEPTAAAPSGGSGLLNTEQVPQAWREAITTADQQCEGISGPLLAAQIQVESSWNPTATSTAGAQGLAQFMPGTWALWGRDYSGDGIAAATDPLDAIGSQAAYMCHLYDWAGQQLSAAAVTGDPLQLTLAAYNAGPGAVSAAGGIPAIAETQAYVQQVLAAVATYTLTGNSGQGQYDPGDGPAVSADGTYRVPTPGSGRLDVSSLCQIPWARTGLVLRCDAVTALSDLNAAYRAQYGTDLTAVSAYRDYATQVVTKATKGKLAATPGTSNHGWGLAIDLDIGGEASPEHQWLRTNAPTYGWQHPSWARPGGSGPLEAWHWEYVGT